MTIDRLRSAFERLLDTIVILLIAALTLLIIAGFVFRYIGESLTWYDEIASIGLVWLTYFGSALAALKGAHIGFPGIVNAMPRELRVASTIFAEGCVFLFFGVLAWTGWQVLTVLQGETLISLPAVPLVLTQSIIPIGAVLFIVAEALRLPRVLADAREGGFVDHELEDALGADLARSGTRANPAGKPAPTLSRTALEGGHRP